MIPQLFKNFHFHGMHFPFLHFQFVCGSEVGLIWIVYMDLAFLSIYLCLLDGVLNPLIFNLIIIMIMYVLLTIFLYCISFCWSFSSLVFPSYKVPLAFVVKLICWF